MPYKDQVKDRTWHKMKMRERRLKLKDRLLHPTVTPFSGMPSSGIWEDREIDLNGQPIPEYER